MKSLKFISTVIVVSLVISLALLGFQRTEFAGATSEFSFKDIEAEIQIISPADNGSYTGDVSLNISIRFSAYSEAPNSSVIPYQDISCIYQLDNSEWTNASLYSASDNGFRDWVNGGYWNIIKCNYSALLQGLSNGAHLLNVSLKPGEIDLYDYPSMIRIFTSTVNFFVFGNYDKPVPTDTPVPTDQPASATPEITPVPTDQPTSSTPENFLGIIVIAITIIIITLVVLVIKKKNPSKYSGMKCHLQRN